MPRPRSFWYDDGAIDFVVTGFIPLCATRPAIAGGARLLLAVIRFAGGVLIGTFSEVPVDSTTPRYAARITGTALLALISWRERSAA
ncbi:hypothetical protein ACLK1T_24620 [Escherichia coli]